MTQAQKKRRTRKVRRGTPNEEAAVKIALAAVRQGWTDTAVGTMAAAFGEVEASSEEDWAPARKRWELRSRVPKHRVGERKPQLLWSAELAS